MSFYYLELLSDTDEDFSNLFDASGNIPFDIPNTDQDVNRNSPQTNNVANKKYNSRYSASDSSMAEEGSPGSFMYGSPSGSNGSLDSGIRSADLSSPDSPLTPFDGSANLSFPYVDNDSLNLAAMQINLAPMNIQKEATVNPQTESILKQLAQDVAQLKQHISQQQLLLFLQQQKEGNISQPPQQLASQLTQQSTPQLTQQSTPQLTRQSKPQITQPVTLTLQQNGDLAAQKDSQIRKILLMTKSNIDKTKNKIQDTIQETKSMLNKLPKPYKPSSKRKQCTEREDKEIKVSKPNDLLNSSPASNSVQGQDSSMVYFLFPIGLMT